MQIIESIPDIEYKNKTLSVINSLSISELLPIKSSKKNILFLKNEEFDNLLEKIHISKSSIYNTIEISGNIFIRCDDQMEIDNNLKIKINFEN